MALAAFPATGGCGGWLAGCSSGVEGTAVVVAPAAAPATEGAPWPPLPASRGFISQSASAGPCCGVAMVHARRRGRGGGYRAHAKARIRGTTFGGVGGHLAARRCSTTPLSGAAMQWRYLQGAVGVTPRCPRVPGGGPAGRLARTRPAPMRAALGPVAGYVGGRPASGPFSLEASAVMASAATAAAAPGAPMPLSPQKRA